MLILLSCAKTMSGKKGVTTPPFSTQPIFKKQAEEIAAQLTEYNPQELQQILKVNPAIAKENFIRYKHFNRTDTSLEAILSYTGIVFKKLGVTDFTPEDFAYAQNHLRITSFVYGLLRPLDMINLYRLEGDVVLPQFNEKSMFEYWREKLTDILIEDTKQVGGILCNLASNEMRGLFDWKRVERELKVISPEFKTWKNGKLTTIVIYTKIARGETARYIIKNKIERIEDLHLNELPNNE